MLKFSIVTVSYNSALTIEKTILSVLNQHYGNLEYIIIDGGSTDETISIVNKYRQYIDIIISEKDRGISDAFNKGILLSSGDYILLLNSDDALLDNTLEQVDKLMADDTDVLHTNINIVDDNGKIIRIKKPDLNYRPLIRRCMTLNHPGMFIKREAYKQFGLYDISYKCVMDRELISRMYLQGARFQYADIVTANFAIGGESTKNYIKHAIPEGRKISIKNGVSPVFAYTYWTYRYIRVRLGQIKWLYCVYSYVHTKLLQTLSFFNRANRKIYTCQAKNRKNI